MNIDYNKIYTDNSGKEYQIIKDLGNIYYSKNYHSHRVIIKYIESGYENEVEYKSAIKGSVKDNSKSEIQFNKIYSSNNYGDYVILEDLGIIGKQRKLKIRFIDTDYETIINANAALTGAVRDKTITGKYNYVPAIIGTVYTSNAYGDYEIIDDIGMINNKHMVRVKFKNTNYEYNVSKYNAENGIVKDPYCITVYGVGYLGEYDGYYADILYPTWNNMLSRCYNINNPAYCNYGGIGIRVSNEWLCFATFAYDAQNLQGFELKLANRDMYELDKDYLQKNVPHNQKIYSKSTCIWISKYDNTYEKVSRNRNEYIGVRCNEYGTFNVRATINGITHHLDTFSDPIVAANVYNNFIRKYSKADKCIVLNDVPYVDPADFIKYNTNPKEMCKIIN